MSERATDARWALIIGSILGAIFTVGHVLASDPTKTSSPVYYYPGLPGIVVGAVVFGVLRGHGGSRSWAEMLIIATPVNLLVYSALSYFVLRITSPLRRRRHGKGE